jgi:hypothetical protein
MKNTYVHAEKVYNNHHKSDISQSQQQVNLISETIVKKLGLTTKPHKKAYPLGWIHNDNQLQVNRQCVL